MAENVMTSAAAVNLSELISFSVIGIATTTQQLTHAVAGEASDDLELIAEESLALASVTTARVLEIEGKGRSEVAANVLPTILKVPFTYLDYILGSEVLQAPEGTAIPEVQTTYDRISRKMNFYFSHFVPGSYPGPKIVNEKMALWMGRISSPGLHEHPIQRLERLEVVAVLNRHLKLVREFARQQLGESE